MPLVTIITPVYNSARWLREMLLSVQEQTLSDWELILADDGSTDESVRIAELAAAADSRIRLLRQPCNGGPGAARNRALGMAHGRFIAFLDADDLWLPEKLERCIRFMEAHGYGFIYHDYRQISAEGTRVGARVRGPAALDLRTLHTERGVGCLTVVLERERVGQFQFPQDGARLQEDFCAWASLVRNGHLGHRLAEDLARYRLQPHSRSSNKLVSARDTWRVYRDYSHLPVARAAWWWTLYAWNAFWLHRRARP